MLSKITLITNLIRPTPFVKRGKSLFEVYVIEDNKLGGWVIDLAETLFPEPCSKNVVFGLSSRARF